MPGHASSFRGVRLSYLWGEGQGTDSSEALDGRGFHQFAVLSKLSFIDKVSIQTAPPQVAVTLVCSALLRGLTENAI